jgi:stage II sporulation protein D
MKYFNYTAIKAKQLMLILALGWQLLVQAGDIKIGLFNREAMTSITFSVVEGEYVIYGDFRQVDVARKGFIYHIENSRGMLNLQDTSAVFGKYSHIEFRGISSENIFRMKPVFPTLPAKESDDNLILQAENNIISAINILDLEKYIAGTIESEGGVNAHPEYYKAQAILTRTFAIKNYYRHGAEGYNLCDTEHCQAYKGKSRMNPAIQDATLSTKDLVMTDKQGNLVIASYHSNCGGMTSDAFQVWKQPLPYLKPIADPFCIHSRNAVWETKISRTSWNAYLAKRGVEKKFLQQAIINFNPQGREKYLTIGNVQLQMADIRKDLNLKSAWFSIGAGSDSVIFQGKGFGHGVGMCQEGAIEMANKGYVYVDILHFYFTDVRINRIPEKK